jgi:uncharacterized protein YtpQ (UPF0354 family)
MDEKELNERLYEYRKENKKLKIALQDLIAFTEMSPLEQANKIKYYVDAKRMIK